MSPTVTVHCMHCGKIHQQMVDCATHARDLLLAQIAELTTRNADLNAANIKIRNHSAEVTEQMHKVAGDSARKIDLLERELTALQKDFKAVRADARKWRLFTGSSRIRVLGTAGLAGDKRGYAHVGLEIWTTYEHPSVADEKTRALSILDKYLDIAQLTQADQ